MSSATGGHRHDGVARAGARGAARRGPLRPGHAREPRRRRARLARRDAARSSAALGKDSVMFMAADEFPLPYEYRFFALDGLVSVAARRRRGPHDRVPGLRQHRPQPGRRAQARRRAHPQHRPPPRQHALRDGQPRRARGLVHGRDRVGPHARARASSPRTAIAEALYVGLVTDTGRFMYENTGTARPRHGRRADRRRRRRPRDLPPPLRGRSRYGKLELLARGAGQRRALRRGRADHHPPHRRGLRRDAAPRRATPRASSTTCAPSQGTRGGRARARPARRRPGGPRKVSLRATDDRVDVSAIARAQGGGGHRQAAGFTTDDGVGRAGGLPARARSPRSSASRVRARRRRRPAGRQAGRARPRTTSSRPCAASWPRAAGRPRRARWIRSRPACCSCWSAARRGCSASSWRCPRPTRPSARFGAVSTTGDPEGEIAETGRVPADAAGAADRARSASARPRTRRSRSDGRAGLQAGAARGGGRGARAHGHACTASTQLWRDGRPRRASRSSARRAPTSASWSPTSATPTAWSCAGRAIGAVLASRTPTPGAWSRSTTRSRSCPSVGSARTRPARRPRSPCRARPRATVRLTAPMG